VAPSLEQVLVPLQAALEACGDRGPFASVAWGLPEPDDGQWLDLDAFATEAGAAPAIRRSTPPDGDPANIIGHWTLQNASGTPLLTAGYLYAAHRRVPALRGNALLHNSQWLQHLRLRQPRLTVLPDDPLRQAEGITTVGDQAELTAALFAEVERTYQPIVDGFRARRLVFAANAWASVVDNLLQGFLLAGRAAIGLDQAWALWHRVTSTWTVPTRRWPRRLTFFHDGVPEELAVRAACCLVFTTKDAAGASIPNCPNCPLDIGDQGRVDWMRQWLDQLGAAEGARK
jgi:hypothetical protein